MKVIIPCLEPKIFNEKVEVLFGTDVLYPSTIITYVIILHFCCIITCFVIKKNFSCNIFLFFVIILHHVILKILHIFELLHFVILLHKCNNLNITSFKVLLDVILLHVCKIYNITPFTLFDILTI